MAWNGEAEDICYGVSHKGICPLLKQWRRVAKGKATVESSGLLEAMVEYLRAAVSAVTGGRAVKFTKTKRQPPHSITACVDGCVQHSINGSSKMGEGETGSLTPSMVTRIEWRKGGR